MNTTNNPLLTLLAQAQQSIQQKRQEEAARFEAGKQAIQEYLETSLPDLWPVLAPYADITYKHRRSGGIEASYTIRQLDEMRLAAMYLRIQATPRQKQDGMTWCVDGYWSYDNGARKFPLSETPRAVLDAYTRWEQADLNRRLKEARKIVKPLLYQHQAPDDEAEALALVERASAICPENADEWQNTLARWRKIQADREREARKKHKRALIRSLADIAVAGDETRLEEHIALCIQQFPEDREEWDRHLKQGREIIAYRQALETYARQRLDVLDANRAKAAALLAELAAPVQAYELTYGVCAEDEDGGRYVETRSVIVLDADPDEAGYWQVVRHGSAKPVRYLHPVSVAPVPAPVRTLHVPALGQRIEYPSTRTSEEIRRAIDALELTPLPPAPEAPEALDSYTQEKLIHSVPDAFLEITTTDDDLPW